MKYVLQLCAIASILLSLVAGEVLATEKVKLATVAPTGSPWIDSLEGMSKDLEKRSAGAYRLQIFPGGQLGGEIETIESIQFGTVECAGISAAAMANLLPSMQVFEIPFFWKSREEAYYVLDNHFRGYFSQKMAELGLELLGWSENGWRHFFTVSDKAIRTPEDLRGLQMRSQESPVHVAFWKSLGVNPIPLAVTDLYQALERGTVDGADNTIVFTAAAGWIEVAKSFTLSGHIYQPAVLACNKLWWDSVPPAQQVHFKKAMLATEKDTRDRLLASEKELLAAFREMGKAIVDLTPEELAVFEKRTIGVRSLPNIMNLLGPDVLRIAAQGKREFQQKQTQ